jgi:hypothetical protein
MNSYLLNGVSLVFAVVSIGLLVASLFNDAILLVAIPCGIIAVVADHYGMKAGFREFHERHRKTRP